MSILFMVSAKKKKKDFGVSVKSIAIRVRLDLLFILIDDIPYIEAYTYAHRAYKIIYAPLYNFSGYQYWRRCYMGSS